MDHLRPPIRRYNSTCSSISSDVFEPSSNSNARQRVVIIEWLCSILPDLRFPIITSDDDLRAFLLDGTVLCRILNKLRPGSVTECAASENSKSENVKRFLAAMDELGLPSFELLDLQQGSMKIVMECLLSLKVQNMPKEGGYTLRKSNSSGSGNDINSMKWKLLGIGSPEGTSRPGPSIAPPSIVPSIERRKSMPDSKFRRALSSQTMAEPSAALLHHVGHKFQEVFQLKHGGYGDLSAAKISEMMKATSLDNAPTHSLLSVVNGIIDESVERKNGEIPLRVACLLRKVVQEIERRISTHAENLKNEKQTFKAREEKYQSRIRVLEALAAGRNEETKSESTKIEEKKKTDEEKKMEKLVEQRNKSIEEVATLRQELETVRAKYEHQCKQMETDSKGNQIGLKEKLKEVENLLAESRNRVKELEAYSESISQGWKKKEHIYKKLSDFQLNVVRDLRVASHSIKQEMMETQKSYIQDFNRIGTKTRAMEHAAENYHAVLAENRRLHNEVQDLKGNIRVYCRIRPFLPGQMGKQSIVEHVGDTGELVVVNPSKSGKEGRRTYKFNRVYGPTATQAEVFSDIRPLIRSVLDGYNVCIFAYGQTGAGKTYTMTGPDGATEEEWGVNYRALNDLFRISQSRKDVIEYEIGVQMVEVYNEQVRDILSTDPASKRLGIVANAQASGLAVPDATMHTVTKPSDVLALMEIGLKNRAKSSTAMNERSSRSHSIVTIHVRGKDLKTSSVIKASLHLVDLAGSERVDRSEAIGDRLKEAQHINKSLAALGDVISALSQKSSHIPYRNSKLTQVLQSSLGGQAKTLMFVQLNPDLVSFSESTSTLKFAERASGVELGAARSNKEAGRDVKELMDQVVSLQDTISKKEEEIERLQLLKDQKNSDKGSSSEDYVGIKIFPGATKAFENTCKIYCWCVKGSRNKS